MAAPNDQIYADVSALTCSADFKKRINNLFLKVGLVNGFLSRVNRDKDNLSRFGLKTSHTLRDHFLRLVRAAGLSHEAYLWLYLFCARARTKDRIKAGVKTLSAELRNSEPVQEAMRFLDNRMVTWPDQETDQKFATVHLPNTCPGLASLMIVITDPDTTVEDFLSNTWTPQIHWHSEFQPEVKLAATKFWTQVVTHTTHGSRRVRRPEEGRFNEGIFETQMKDEYPLVYITDDGELAFYPGAPYKKADLEAYLAWAKDFSTTMASIEPPPPPPSPTPSNASGGAKRRSLEEAGGSGQKSQRRDGMEVDPNAQ